MRSKAHKKLGWKPQYDLEYIVEDMMKSDLKLILKEKFLKKGGFDTLNNFD